MNNQSFEIQSLLNGYRSGSLKVVDVIKESLRRINEGDSKIWISIDTEARLLEQAVALSDKDPNSLPLYGIPFGVKDNIDVAGLPTTAACPDYQRFSEYDATVVALLKAAGGIPIGKTNLDQFATGLVGVRSPYGTPENAFDANYVPGGSSAGSAVSVALGQVSFALGTDTAGSGRVPACFNNLVGLKPSRGLLSNHGVVPACRSLDCVSVFSLHHADAQRVFRAAAARDEKDPYSRAMPRRLDTVRRIHRNDLCFGIPDPTQLRFFGNEDYQELYLEAIARLESLGYVKKVIDIEPLLAAARLLYSGPWVAERYWAIQEMIENTPDSLHPTTRAIIEKGRDNDAVDTFDAFYQLQAFKARSDQLLETVDFVVTPTTGTHYTTAEVEGNPIELNSNLGYYTNFMNLLDLSALAVPTGFTKAQMPFGITLFAPAFHDEKLLAIGHRLQLESSLPLGATGHRIYREPEIPSYDSTEIAVCGAHMSGLPLNGQLTSRGATLAGKTVTAEKYRLFALPDTNPPKPGLVRDEAGGKAIEIELWNLPTTQWAAFIAEIPSPLGIGNLELEDGSYVKGFLCETSAIENAKEVTELGSWRRFVDT